MAEALDAGIDVTTTLNIQHIESLNDAVARITGVRVQETVPDAIVARAELILSGAALPALGAHVLSSFRKSVAGVAAVAGVRGRSQDDEV